MRIVELHMDFIYFFMYCSRRQQIRIHHVLGKCLLCLYTNKGQLLPTQKDI